MIRTIITSCFLLLAATACSDQFRLGPSLPQGMEGLATAATGASDVPDATTDGKSTTIVEGGLAVQAEVLAPDDIWRDQIAELRKRTSTTPPKELQRWVVQQSAALITDRIAESLLYQKASSNLGDGAEPNIQTYIDGEIRKVVTEKFDGIQRRYEKALEKSGRNLEDVRRQLRRQAIIGAYLEADVRSKVPEPTRAELAQTFEQLRESMRKPGRRSMSLIDIRSNRFIPAGLASPTRVQSDQATTNAKNEALAALNELRAGTEFADVARRRSHGLHAVDGGKWGWITRDAVRDRFLPAVDAMQKLSTGEFSELINAQDGFFIVRCDRAEDPYEPDFVTAQPLIHNRIVNQRHNRAIATEVARLRQDANIGESVLVAFHKRVVKSVLSASRN